ncbi:MAG: hypothetical protein V3W18_14725 [candidate division Zixibacteria bacterium]
MNDDLSFKSELMIEQYGRLHESRRQHMGFIWQIPSVVVGAVLLFIGLTPEEINIWNLHPYIPCLGSFVIMLFTFVMFIFHRRNVRFLKNFESVLSDIEQENGIYRPIYAGHADTKWRWFNRIRSSKCLEYFLLIIFLLSVFGFLIFFYFWLC